MNKKIVNKIISALGVMALVGMVYLGVNAFKGVEVAKASPEVEMAAEQALLVALGKGNPAAKAESTRMFANPQWFTYQLDPTDISFGADKLIRENYLATGITNPSMKPCPSNGNFCSIYAETIVVDGVELPDITPGTSIRTALSSYVNNTGDQTLIDEEGN